MAFSYRELFFGGTTFCCCLKVRLGVMIMAVLGMLFAGLLSILLWFEVSTSSGFSTKERAVFIVAGLVETLLFVASMLGFVGAVVRKQLFVQIYAYFLYVHFLLNLGVAAYLLYFLVHVSTTDQVKACQLAIHNTAAQNQCTGIFQVGLGVYGGVASAVLLIELYGAFIIARYVNQIQREKRNVRASRASYRASRMSQGSSLKGLPGTRYSTIRDPDQDSIPLRAARASTIHEHEDFDPYEEIHGPDYQTTSTAYDAPDLEQNVPAKVDTNEGGETNTQYRPAV